MKIIKEEEIELKNGIWKQIIYDTGEIVLKKYDEEFKVWIIINFHNYLCK